MEASAPAPAPASAAVTAAAAACATAGGASIRSQRQSGLTVLELVITMLVFSVLTVIAAPGLSDYLRNSRTVATTNDLVAAIRYARAEAIRRAAPVRLTANDTNDGASRWGKGWRVWVDANGNNQRDAGEELRTQQALSSTMRVNIDGGFAEIGFLASGFADLPLGTQRLFRIQTVGCKGQSARTVALTNVGFVNVATASC